ncbi:MAG TPA: hypothetical protein VHZ81_12815 [Galbitalea sp.]|nr:hypothetical protein [Galbitalea sp.]
MRTSLQLWLPWLGLVVVVGIVGGVPGVTGFLGYPTVTRSVLSSDTAVAPVSALRLRCG